MSASSIFVRPRGIVPFIGRLVMTPFSILKNNSGDSERIHVPSWWISALKCVELHPAQMGVEGEGRSFEIEIQFGCVIDLICVTLLNVSFYFMNCFRIGLGGYIRMNTLHMEIPLSSKQRRQFGIPFHR
jgi:hypothetical protein